jgi:hypothetical protein
MTRDWELLAIQSPSVTAQAIQEAMEQGEVDEASKGIRELAHVLSKSDERELRSRLIILMTHIFKWYTQPPGTKSWRLTIRTQRQEIAALRESNSRFTRRFIEEYYLQRCLEEARDNAEEEMDTSITHTSLTWEEVFEQRYDERQPEGNA